MRIAQIASGINNQLFVEAMVWKYFTPLYLYVMDKYWQKVKKIEIKQVKSSLIVNLFKMYIYGAYTVSSHSSSTE